jgi:hypothetical protein
MPIVECKVGGARRENVWNLVRLPRIARVVFLDRCVLLRGCACIVFRTKIVEKESIATLS